MSATYPPWGAPKIDPQVMSTPRSNPFNFHPSFNEYGELQNGERMLQGNAGDPADNAAMSCAIAHVTNGKFAGVGTMPREGDVVCFRSNPSCTETNFKLGKLFQNTRGACRAATVINGNEDLGGGSISIAMHPLSKDGDWQCGVLVSIEKRIDVDVYVLVIGIEHFSEVTAPAHFEANTGDTIGMGH